MKTKKSYLVSILLITIFVHSFSQISYTKFTPSKTVPFNNLNGLSINLNNDTIVDFIFRYLGAPSGPCCAYGPVTYRYHILIGVKDTGQIIKNSDGRIVFNNLDSITNSLDSIICTGKYLGCDKIVVSSQTCDMTQCNTISFDGLSEAIGGKYFVVKFLIENNYHYGWIKFSKKEGVNIEIQSVAYNIKANESFRINDPNPTTVLKCPIDDKVSIYPNPFVNIITVGVKDLNYKRLYLTNLIGHVIISQDINSELSIINTENLLHGAYILILEADNYRTTKLLIK